MVNLASGISAHRGPQSSRLLQDPEQKMADALPDVGKGIGDSVSAAANIAQVVIQNNDRDQGHDVDDDKQKTAPETAPSDNRIVDANV